MDAYATVAELERSWRALTDAEQARAGDLLLRASGFMAAEMAARGVSPDTSDDTTALNLSTVCCNIVRRSMSNGAVQGGYVFSDGSKGLVLVDAANSEGAFEVPEGSEVRIDGGEAMEAVKVERHDSLDGSCHHWEIEVR